MFDTANPASEAISLGHSAAALVRTRLPHWRPGLAAPPYNEIFASSDEASGVGLALALARDALKVAAKAIVPAQEDRRQVLWVQDKAAVRLAGRPYAHGLPSELRHRLIHVEAGTPEDALFALEEGLRCRDLAFVLGEIAGNPRGLNFTTSRRLSLVAEKHHVPLWLVRLDAEPDLSAARMRWKVVASPSLNPRWNADAPGHPSWRAELFRARSHPPGEWSLSDDGSTLIASRPHSGSDGLAATPDHVDLARAAGGRSLAAL
jgi:protein ImuA